MKIVAALVLALSLSAMAKTPTITNVNTAPADSLAVHLPGVGPAIADRIVEERKAGKFSDCADLESRVKGLGDKKMAKLCPFAQF